MATWDFISYDDSSPTKIAEMIAADLELAKETAVDTKVAISNQHDGPARGVIFTPSAPSLHLSSESATWLVKTLETKDNYNGIYEDATNFLNSLSDSAAYLAKATFSNDYESDAFLHIIFPEFKAEG